MCPFDGSEEATLVFYVVLRIHKLSVEIGRACDIAGVDIL